MELSTQDNNIRITKGLTIKVNEFENGMDILESNFNMQNVNVRGNKIGKNLIQHKKGKLVIDTIEVKENKGIETTKALIYEAAPDGTSEFVLRNFELIWTNTSDSHPPLLDIFLGAGYYSLENIRIESYSNSTVTTAAVEVGSPNAKGYKSTISNVTAFCTTNLKSKQNLIGSIRGKKLSMICKPCEIKKYTMQKSFLRLKGNSSKYAYKTYKDDDRNQNNLLDEILTDDESREFTCHDCPVGGSCKNGIRSSGNFYGYDQSDGQVLFTACPRAYCCTKKECKSIDSCKSNRTGTLCGSCKEGFQEDFFTAKCVPKSKCKNRAVFWFFFALSALVVCVLFLFMKDITVFLKSLFGRLCSCCSKSEEGNEVDQDQDWECKISSSSAAGHGNEDEVQVIMIAKPEEEKQLTMSGAFNIIVGFYQIRSLLTVDLGTKYENSTTYQSEITRIFDLDFTFIKSICPMEGLTAKGEGFIKNQLIVIFMLLWAILFLIIYFVLKLVKRFLGKKSPEVPSTDEDNQQQSTANGNQQQNNGEDTAKTIVSDKLPFHERVGLGMIKIILFGYKNVATFAIISFHCVDIKGKLVLFINGDQPCFQWWQNLEIVFLVLWAIPFPAALMVSYRMYMRYVISLKKFVAILIFPYLAIYFMFAKRSTICLATDENDEKRVTKLLKEMFEEAYRKRNDKEYYVFWETWRLYQRLILAFVTTFAINPVNRICYAAPIILLFIYIYWFVKPYKEQFTILHWMEVIGLLGITFTLINNMFRSFLYVFDIPDQPPIPKSLQVLWYMDLIASPVFVLVFFFCLKPVSLLLLGGLVTSI
uniref:Uncharacterized protein n=2 Tax=Clytia hemisphaerica TaxID=252671 RepID=A0A7M5V891_9CNID